MIEKPCFSSVFGEEITALALEDDRICVITAAMEEGTGLQGFHEKLPGRFFDEGIAEGHCASMCGGMAKQGMKPVFAVYSTFIQRSYDMLIQDVAMLRLPVVLAIDRAGLVGSDGETHNGVFDVGMLRQIPGIAIWCPSSHEELRQMLRAALAWNGPAAIRYPRGEEGEYREYHLEPITVLRQGEDVTLVGYGILINELISAAGLLERKGIHAQVIKLGRIDSVDMQVLERLLPDGNRVIVIEVCVETGSVGEHISAHFGAQRVRMLNLGKNGFVRQGSVRQQWKACGIDADAIADKAAET